MQAAIIKDGVVINVVVLPDDWTNESKDWSPPEGCTVELLKSGTGIGDSFDKANNTFIKEAN